MAIETEIKLRVENLPHLRQRLRQLRARVVHARHFEDNYVLDYADGRLRQSRCLLRVRLTGKGDSLTYKGAPLPDGPFKTREEVETGVADGRRVLEILGRMGLQTWFRYQKYREEYFLFLRAVNAAEAADAGRVDLALDETPVGCFVELEGSADAIRGLASELGYSESQFLRSSYYSLYKQSRPEADGRPFMLFEEE